MHRYISLVVILACLTFSCKPSKYADLEDGMYAQMETSKGTILLNLEFEKTPITVASFVSLADGSSTVVSDSLKGKPFYNGLKFHRVMKDFMIQGGDPRGVGTGGPGYVFENEFPKDSAGNLILKHDKAGILSMANSGGPSSNGSQFFITHKETAWLDGKHSVFGHVVKGQNVVNAIVQNDLIKDVKIIKVGRDAKKFDASETFENYYLENQKKVKAKQERVNNAVAATIAKIGENSKKMKEYPSGLKMVITETVDGLTPALGTLVKVNYAGYFTNGRLFDTSYSSIAKAYEVYSEDRDKEDGYEPFTTSYGPEANLIAGFKEGLQEMKIGDKAMLFVPSHLGYGAQGMGNIIPPNTDLIFELELVEIDTEKQ